MKTLTLILSVLVVACLTVLSSCWGPDCPPQCVRVKTFFWDETLYRAKYNAAGRLVKLQGSDRDITFLYDEDQMLYEATVNVNGEVNPNTCTGSNTDPSALRKS